MAQETATDLECRLAQAQRELSEARAELAEALEQQTATSEVLSVISQSHTDVQPVFDAVAESAARLCDSFDSAVWRREGDRLLLVAPYGAISQTGARLFSERQIALLQTFADQAVIAIENTRLLNELRQRTNDLSESLEQQTATSEVLSVISSSPGELQPVFQAMLENAVKLCDAKFGMLNLFDGEVFRNVAVHNVPPAYADN